MSIQTIIFSILGFVTLILVASNIFLFRYSYQIGQKIDKLLEKGKIKDFKDIFLSQKDKINDLEEKIKESFLRIESLEKISEKTIQKIGIVRFDPFNEMGGKQSFAVAALDDKNNGFIISSLFVKEGNRVFAKPIKNGKSEYVLSNEELEAIKKAVNYK